MHLAGGRAITRRRCTHMADDMLSIVAQAVAGVSNPAPGREPGAVITKTARCSCCLYKIILYIAVLSRKNTPTSHHSLASGQLHPGISIPMKLTCQIDSLMPAKSGESTAALAWSAAYGRPRGQFDQSLGLGATRGLQATVAQSPARFESGDQGKLPSGRPT